MKILNVNCTIDPETGGGTAARILKMSEHIALEGHACTILSVHSEKTKFAESSGSNGVDVILLPCLFKRFYFPAPTLKTFKAIMSAVENADIVHLMSHWTVLNALVYFSARLKKKKYVFSPAGALAIYGRSQLLKRCYNFIIGDRIVRNASACIAITKLEIAEFIKYGVSKSTVRVFPNGVDLKDFVNGDSTAFRKKNGIKQKKIILFVGRLNRIKGPDLLLKAFAEVKEYVGDMALVFVGPDEGLKEELQNLVAAHHLEGSVKFAGYLNNDEKIGAYKACSFLAIPSRNEAMSLVALEAGIMQKPVLLTDQCGFDEIEHVGGGILCSPDVDGLKKGIMAMVDKLNQNDSQMGERLFDFVKKNYGWENLIKRLTGFYKNIINKDRAE